MLIARVSEIVTKALPLPAEVVLTVPPDAKFGDLATNVAMVLAKKLGKPPREVAEGIGRELDPKYIERYEVAGPGFLNLFLKPALFQDVFLMIEKEGTHFGEVNLGKEEEVLLEFISANPTGPLTIANGRGGFGGDVLARVLRRAGYLVDCEYYINDAGHQIDILGASIQAAAGRIAKTEEMYQGEYIAELAKKHANLILPDVYETGRRFARILLEEYIKPSILRMQLEFNHWQSEYDLREKGGVEETYAFLAEKKLSYEKDGAVFLATSQFGDDKDRVIKKSDVQGGESTYILPDLMYHRTKFQRGYTKLIDILGADHHGYVPRLKIGVKMLGFSDVEVIITQLVKLFRGGEEVRMSKRTGNFELMDDLITEVGHDVARWFFVMRDWNTHLNFDLDLAKSQSQDNPVYYVQYAHTRLAGILRQAAEKTPDLDWKQADAALLVHPAELALIRRLAELPDLVVDIARSYTISRLTTYAHDLAADFHQMYDRCRVIDLEHLPQTAARLRLVATTKEVLRIVLEELVGVSAPEQM